MINGLMCLLESLESVFLSYNYKQLFFSSRLRTIDPDFFKRLKTVKVDFLLSGKQRIATSDSRDLVVPPL